MKNSNATAKINHKDNKSFNTQVYELVCNRLKLKRREKIIFFKLIGFLLRNDKPFPYTIEKLELNSGYKSSSIYECINLLEKYGLIERVGFTSRVRYSKGYKLIKYCSLVQNRIKNRLYINSTLVQKMEELISASPETGYQNTSLSLKHKEGNQKITTTKPKKPSQMDLQEYFHGVKGYEWVGEWRKEQGL
jgi:predicted transcriptional regulator